MKRQLDVKDNELQVSLQRLNQLKLEAHQQRALEKQMRRDVVKGTADALKKKKYLAMNQKVKAKEQQIEEAKQLVDSMIEKRRLDLAERHLTN